MVGMAPRRKRGRRVLEVGPKARVIFAAIWIAGQSALILTAGRRSEAAFGFRMFSESSTLSFSLTREIDAPSGHGERPVILLRVEASNQPDDRCRVVPTQLLADPGTGFVVRPETVGVIT